MMKVYCFLFLFMPVAALAQRAEVLLDLGYAVSGPNSDVGVKQIDVLTDDLSVSRIKGSYGAGFWYGISVRRSIHDHVQLGLGFSRLAAPKMTINLLDQGGNYWRTTAQTSQARLLPYLRLHAETGKFRFYMQCGLVIPVAGNTMFSSEWRTAPDTLVQSESRLRYQFDFGYQQGMGVDLRISEHWALGLAMEAVLLQLRASKQNMTSYQVNGVDQMAALTRYQKDINYHEDLNNFSNNAAYNYQTVSSEARDELTFSSAFSSLSWNVKLIWRF